MTGNDFAADGFYNSDFGDSYYNQDPNNEYETNTTYQEQNTGRPSYPRIREQPSTVAQNRIRPHTIKQKPGSTNNASNASNNTPNRFTNATSATSMENNFMEVSDPNGLSSPHSNIASNNNNTNNKYRTRTNSSSSSSSSSSRNISSMSNPDAFFTNVSNVAYGLGMGVATAVATGQSSNLPTELLSQTYQQYTSSFLSYNYYRYYFKVDNTYVLHKITKILLPFLKLKPEDWHRKMAYSTSPASPLPMENEQDDSTDVITSLSPEQASKIRRDRNSRNQSKWFNNSPFEPPINDINAPDMYIPLMAIITYIVIMGFAVGIQQQSKFTPQVLVATASSAFGMLIFEVLIMKSGFWFIGNVAIPPFWLDLICYAGYKLIFVVLNLGIFTLFPSFTVYYIVSIVTGCLAGLFMIQTLRPYFRTIHSSIQADQDLLYQGNNISEHSSNKTKQIFLGLVGLAQLIFIQLMGRYIS